jgi:hypothetical protein
VVKFKIALSLEFSLQCDPHLQDGVIHDLAEQIAANLARSPQYYEHLTKWSMNIKRDNEEVCNVPAQLSKNVKS